MTVWWGGVCGQGSVPLAEGGKYNRWAATKGACGN